MRKKPIDLEAPASVTAEPTIPITKAELLVLEDAAKGLAVIKAMSKGVYDANISEVSWIIDKIAQPLWDLACDDFISRWHKHNPDVDLIAQEE